MAKALLVIDLQNDYFPGSAFQLWNTEPVLANTERAIARANEMKIPVIIIQHIANTSQGPAPFFNRGTPGAEIHPRILAQAQQAPIIIKTFADSFLNTDLEETLKRLGTTDLIICGMMTQNCVTHTAISKAAEKYRVTVLSDCSTTVSEMIHKIALNALSARVTITSSKEALDIT